MREREWLVIVVEEKRGGGIEGGGDRQWLFNGEVVEGGLVREWVMMLVIVRKRGRRRKDGHG